MYAKQWMWRISSWILQVIIKDSCRNNYLKKLFSQAYCYVFSIQNSFFCQAYCFNLLPFLSIYKNFVRLLAWHSTIKNCKAYKEDEWRINANRVASQKIVDFLYVRIWEKRNRTDFSWVMLLMRVSGIETFCHTKTWYSSKIFMNILSFLTQKIIHEDLIKFSSLIFLGQNFPKYILGISKSI